MGRGVGSDPVMTLPIASTHSVPGGYCGWVVGSAIGPGIIAGLLHYSPVSGSSCGVKFVFFGGGGLGRTHVELVALWEENLGRESFHNLRMLLMLFASRCLLGMIAGRTPKLL